MAHCNDGDTKWSGKRTVPVGAFKPNLFGLYDTAGNVWEWVQDCWHENYEGAPEEGSAWLEAGRGDCGWRVIRGGCWLTEPEYARSSARNGEERDACRSLNGFRIAQNIE
jgi:formylglycine-generating enzyme required for sulfatase activity